MVFLFTVLKNGNSVSVVKNYYWWSCSVVTLSQPSERYSTLVQNRKWQISHFVLVQSGLNR